jgi:signal peptidase I
MFILFRILNYFTSKTYRESRELADAVHKMFECQREQLSQKAVAELETALGELRASLDGPRNIARWKELSAKLNEAAERWIKAFPFGGYREYVIMGIELVILVLGSRAFFVQPMEIPTGSAQPTFWGITQSPIDSAADVPNWPARLWKLFIKGDAYCFATAEVAGDLEVVEPPHTLIPLVPFCNRARVRIGGHVQTLYFVPDDYGARFGFTDDKWNLRERRHFGRGEPIIAAVMHSGDHLFVERVSYNFRRPRRGETIVFRSEHHPGMTARTHYIKRLVGLGGEEIRIGDDRHAYINGRPLGTNDPGFENVYSFDPTQPPMRDHYSGHVNEKTARRLAGIMAMAWNFPDGDAKYNIRPKHYVCFGDNTMNSADSRYWGVPDFPQERVIGKSFLVFWPFTERLGWSRH